VVVPTVNAVSVVVELVDYLVLHLATLELVAHKQPAVLVEILATVIPELLVLLTKAVTLKMKAAVAVEVSTAAVVLETTLELRADLVMSHY
jgi:hypothetical protein